MPPPGTSPGPPATIVSVSAGSGRESPVTASPIASAVSATAVPASVIVRRLRTTARRADPVATSMPSPITTPETMPIMR
jgi:hypothetical protein